VTFSQEANENAMSKVAKKSGGNHYHADSGEALMDAFEEVAKSLPTLITD